MTKRTISILLAIVIAVMSLTFPGVAQTPSEENEVVISTTAGQNGMYTYDPETNTETYIPNDSDRSFTSTTQETHISPPPMFFQQDTPRAIDTLVALPNFSSLSGYKLSTCLLGARFTSDDASVQTGTGWLLNNKYVVTAGHVIYDSVYSNNGRNGFAQHVAVYVGATNGQWKQFRLGKKLTIGGDFKNNDQGDDYFNFGMWDDWGVIELETPVTVNVSKLTPVETNSCSSIRNLTLTTQGYPKTKQTPGSNFTKFVMYTGTGTVYQDLADPRVLPVVGSSNIKLDIGQSGSPLYNGSSVYAIAISEIRDYTSCFILINSWLKAKFDTDFSY